MWRELKEVIFMYLTKAEIITIVAGVISMAFYLSDHPLKSVACYAVAAFFFLGQATYEAATGRYFEKRGTK